MNVETFKKNGYRLMEYIRDETGNKHGLMISFREDDNVYVGWALCRMGGIKEQRDEFNRDRGIEIAIGRAYKYYKKPYPKVRPSIKLNLKNFTDRIVPFWTKTAPAKFPNMWGCQY